MLETSQSRVKSPHPVVSATERCRRHSTDTRLGSSLMNRYACRTRCAACFTAEKPGDAKIFVKPGPVQTYAISDHLDVLAFGWRGSEQAREPCNGDGYGSRACSLP